MTKQATLRGSLRPQPPGTRVAAVDGRQRVTVSVYLRRNTAMPAVDVEALGALPPAKRKYLTADQFRQVYGVSDDDVAAFRAFAAQHQLDVIEVNPTTRRVQVSGTLDDLTAAFGAEDLAIYEHDNRRFRARSGVLSIPDHLKDVIEGVFGLDNRRLARSYRRRLAHAMTPPQFSYFPTDLAKLYKFPDSSGDGQCIGLFEFGGKYSSAVLNQYCTMLKVPAPQLADITVHEPSPADRDDPGAIGEVMLDLQVAAAIVPAAKLAVYFSVFTQQGWIDAIQQAVADFEHNPSILSISWGNSEDGPGSAWTGMGIRLVNDAFQAAAARGITICCASGDDGTADDITDRLAHADFPASSPYVLACGGTRLEAAHDVISREVVWNEPGGGGAGGGGISALFEVPSWQQSMSVPASANPGGRAGRGVPDVSGLADPETGYKVLDNDGKALSLVGGTSATAPLWAALVARLNHLLGAHLGYFNPLLYAQAGKGVLRDITDGNNGAYAARVGWDACTGLGSPDGERLLAALKGG
jgi:kumamolisin